MHKIDLIDKIAENHDLSKRASTSIVNDVLAQIQESLVAGEKVTFTGFGSFEVRERAARTGRNPQTNEPMDIPATKVAAFHPGNTLRQAVKAQ
jgi:DNA-binding protein HU-beta